jgi:leucyl aminopeptidase (aminopeptidase T)
VPRVAMGYETRMNNLTFEQLSALLDSVFAPGPAEQWLTIMVDLPGGRLPDNEAWRDRRRIAREWFDTLHGNGTNLPFTSVVYCEYANVGSHNNELPDSGSVVHEPAAMDSGSAVLPMSTILESSSVVIAPTEMSATAPLKLLARTYGFRGATLPGFARAMIPALTLDYESVHARVMQFRDRLERAEGVAVRLAANGRDYSSYYDLRFRSAHASGGLMREIGTVGNLPSGEAYIVPYEGEHEAEPSRTAGELPVQFGDEIVVFRLEQNRAVEVLSTGPESERERQLLSEEPAYGNIAEVGIGVLGEWGVKAMGSMLLDEKLGLHIAFGRSDHFGGMTGPAAFRSRDRVVHIDWVYVGSTQPLVSVVDVTFVYPDDSREMIMDHGAYLV